MPGQQYLAPLARARSGRSPSEVVAQIAGERLSAQAVVGAERHDDDLGAELSAQSMRRSPPADVSPLTPALTTR